MYIIFANTLKMKHISNQVSIAEPCTQNWEQMQKYGGYNFCESCQKCVIDFSGYTNEAILKALANSKTDICGRLSQTQLNQLNFTLIVSTPSRNWMKYLGVLAIGVSIFVQDAKATIVKNATEFNPISLKSDDPKPVKLKLIYGYVLDKENKPLTNVHISILNTKLFAITDKNGRYEIKIDKSINLTNGYLTASDRRYTGQLKLNTAQEKQNSLLLEERKIMIMGLIAIKKNVGN